MPFGIEGGSLVQNGGFEQGLTNWTATNVDLAPSSQSHEGLISAAMGSPDNCMAAELLQDVPVVPRAQFKLELFVSGVAANPANLTIDVRWFCEDSDNPEDPEDLGSALKCGPVLVPGITTGPVSANAWKAVIICTLPAPPEADFARILLTKAPGTLATNFLLIDDVSFVGLD